MRVAHIAFGSTNERQRNTRKAGAFFEGISADARQLAIFAESDARKTGAIIEGRRADACHTVGKRDARKAGATREGIRADARHAIGIVMLVRPSQ